MTVVAIHQPNFFPWLGFFDKYAKADIFVALDHVAPARGGASRTNRVEILVNQKKSWITAPIVRGCDARRCLNETPFAGEPRWRLKLNRTVRQSYARAPHADEIIPFLDDLFHLPSTTLGEFNTEVVHALVERLNLNPAKMVRSSELDSDLHATDLLVELVQRSGGDTYLSGDGAEDYQRLDAFAQAGIAISFQDYRHPIYKQAGGSSFVPGLSIIDALMNCGFAGTADLVRNGSQEPY